MNLATEITLALLERRRDWYSFGRIDLDLVGRIAASVAEAHDPDN